MDMKIHSTDQQKNKNMYLGKNKITTKVNIDISGVSIVIINSSRNIF